jgi:hypothetical protein
VLALLNVFGQRPSTDRAVNDAAELSVFSPVRVRGGLLFTTRFTVVARKALATPRLVLDPGWVEGMQVNSITPQPADESSRDGRIVLDLGRIASGHSVTYFMEFQVNPTNVGRRRQSVRLEGAGSSALTIDRTITVFP